MRTSLLFLEGGEGGGGGGGNHLVGLVVKVSSSREADPGFQSSSRRNFSWSSQTSDFKIVNPVAILAL